MEKLLKINGVAIPDPLKGNLTLGYNDNYKEYQTEDGHSTIEVVRLGKIEGAVKYGGLFANELATIKNAITFKSTVEVYDPFTGQTREIDAIITGISVTNKVHMNNISAWGLSFNIKEL